MPFNFAVTVPTGREPRHPEGETRERVVAPITWSHA
jgi:hypothetical protein